MMKGTNNTPPATPFSFNGKNFCSNKSFILFQGGGKESKFATIQSTVYSKSSNEH